MILTIKRINNLNRKFICKQKKNFFEKIRGLLLFYFFTKQTVFYEKKIFCFYISNFLRISKSNIVSHGSIVERIRYRPLCS